MQPPLYLEDEPEEELEETLNFQENKYYTLSKEEEGEENLPQVSLDEEKIDNYCRWFSDMMQVKLCKKCDLMSRKKSRT